MSQCRPPDDIDQVYGVTFKNSFSYCKFLFPLVVLHSTMSSKKRKWSTAFEKHSTDRKHSGGKVEDNNLKEIRPIEHRFLKFMHNYLNLLVTVQFSANICGSN